nr:Crp/Fnr family transcriptional regulator [Ornithinimicrobium sediminis]
MAPGEPLQRRGEQASAVRIVRDGRLELSVPADGGRLVVQTVRRGGIDGDIQILLGMPMPYDTRAGTATTCLVLERSDFDDLLARHPGLSRRWLSSVAQRLAYSHQRLTSLLGRSLQSQLAQLLLDESVDGVVELPQAALGALVGVQRQSVNTVLRAFVERGMVDVGYGRVDLRDRAQLEAVARHA